MEELELLKKDWQKNTHKSPDFSEQDIYGMLHKKSSSIVKWILIISIVEFLVLRLLDVYTLFDKKSNVGLEKLHLVEFNNIITIVNFIVLFFFIYLFYKNYQKISASSSTKQLMKDILNTRKMVKYYVIYNLGLVFITSVIGMLFLFKYSSKFSHYNSVFTIFLSIFVPLFLVFIFYLIYKLLYGVLLKRLHKNYTELKRIDL